MHGAVHSSQNNAMFDPAQRTQARAISTGHGMRANKLRAAENVKLNANHSSNFVTGQKQIVNHIQTLVRNRNPVVVSGINPYHN